MVDLPRRRKDALAFEARHYFTGIACKRGHIAKRFACNGKCTECHVEVEQQRRAADPEPSRAAARRYARKHPGLASKNGKEWRKANPDKKLEYGRRWLKAHAKEHCERQKRRYSRSGASLRKLSEEEKSSIRAIYQEARRLSVETGIKHHVDHIIPLIRGGEHLPYNLQILTAIDNIRKSDSIPAGMIAPWPERPRKSRRKMTTPPLWAPDFPLAAEGKPKDRYS